MMMDVNAWKKKEPPDGQRLKESAFRKMSVCVRQLMDPVNDRVLFLLGFLTRGAFIGVIRCAVHSPLFPTLMDNNHTHTLYSTLEPWAASGGRLLVLVKSKRRGNLSMSFVGTRLSCPAIILL